MGKNRENKLKPNREGRLIKVGKVADVPTGRSATVKLKDGKEVALFNVGGNFHAVENFCPHKGYQLADGKLEGGVIECKLHGWRFDVTDGKCFTKKKCSIESYEVVIEDDWIKILV